MKVTILLSTYNGEKFLVEQLDSLLSQKYKNLKIIVRDDGSTDRTVQIIESYVRLDSRIKLVLDDLGNLRPSRSFVELLKFVDSELFMFCDQDDFWLPDKVQKAVAHYRADGNSSTPYLSFTDLQVVNEDLSLMARSFNRRQRLDITAGQSFEGALMHNVVTGCTILGNSSLIDKLFLDGVVVNWKSVIMHDWWLCLIAIIYGDCRYYDDKEILYRQHGNNCLGSSGSGIKKLSTLLRTGGYFKKTEWYIGIVSVQAEEFASVYGSSLSMDQREKLALLVDTGQRASFNRMIQCFWKGLRMSTFERNLGLLIVATWRGWS